MDGAMDELLKEDQFNFISSRDKSFIQAFDTELTRRGYTFGDRIGSGFCWGKYMLIYTKVGVKSKKVFARIYIREETIVLRLFLNDLDRHRDFLENTPAYIRQVFTGEHAKCQHCHNDKGGVCRFRKTFTLENQLIEKCNGITFEFHDPNLQNLSDYMSLFNEFYPYKRR
jgi:hypothetical protein